MKASPQTSSCPIASSTPKTHQRRRWQPSSSTGSRCTHCCNGCLFSIKPAWPRQFSNRPCRSCPSAPRGDVAAHDAAYPTAIRAVLYTMTRFGGLGLLTSFLTSELTLHSLQKHASAPKKRYSIKLGYSGHSKRPKSQYSRYSNHLQHRSHYFRPQIRGKDTATRCYTQLAEFDATRRGEAS